MRKYTNIPSTNNVYCCDLDTATVKGKYLTQREHGFIQKCLTSCLGKSAVIFDIGGGSGRFAIPCYKKGYKVIVEEVDILPLKILHKKEPTIPLILLDNKIKHFPIKDSSVDCILCIEVFTLIESDWFFPECNRVLKQNGIIIFTTHNRFSYKGFYKKFILREDYGLYNWKKRHYASPFWKIRLRLKKAGFKIIKAKGFNWIPASRSSNNKFIPFFNSIEKMFHLDLILHLSPWLLITAKKNKLYANKNI